MSEDPGEKQGPPPAYAPSAGTGNPPPAAGYGAPPPGGYGPGYGPPQGGYGPPQGGYGPPQGGYGPPPGGYYPPPPMQQQQQQQQTSVTVVNTAQPAGIVQLGCPHGSVSSHFTACGIICCIFLFPIGILCCLCMMERRCDNCGCRF